LHPSIDAPSDGVVVEFTPSPSDSDHVARRFSSELTGLKFKFNDRSKTRQDDDPKILRPQEPAAMKSVIEMRRSAPLSSFASLENLNFFMPVVNSMGAFRGLRSFEGVTVWCVPRLHRNE
jgi:hypothetical protein